MMYHAVNKSLIKHEAQGFEQCVLDKPYVAEDKPVLQTVQQLHISEVPHGESIVKSHFLYKMKNNENGGLKLKARSAPHGSEDCMKEFLAKNCTIYMSSNNSLYSRSTCLSFCGRKYTKPIWKVIFTTCNARLNFKWSLFVRDLSVQYLYGF